MLIPTPGMPDYIIYEDTVNTVPTALEHEAIGDEIKASILKSLEQELTKLGRIVEITKSASTHV